MDPNEKTQEFFIDEVSLGLIVEAILNKVKENIADVVTKNATDPAVWETIVNGLSKGTVGAEAGDKAVSVALLAEVIAKAKHLDYQLVDGIDIEAAVTDPKENTIYLMRDPDAEDRTHASIHVHTAEGWISAGGVKMPALVMVDTETPDDVNNIILHVQCGETDYSGSTNVHPEEIITAQALTNVLVGLGLAAKKVIPYSENAGKSISEHVGTPAMNTFYAYQQSEDENDWAMYTAVPVTSGSTTKNIWLKISGAEGTTVEVDLSNYWSKDELKPITAEKVTEIVDAAAEKVGF